VTLRDVSEQGAVDAARGSLCDVEFEAACFDTKRHLARIDLFATAGRAGT
jgi:hypothetical protein